MLAWQCHWWPSQHFEKDFNALMVIWTLSAAFLIPTKYKSTIFSSFYFPKSWYMKYEYWAVQKIVIIICSEVEVEPLNFIVSLLLFK